MMRDGHPRSIIDTRPILARASRSSFMVFGVDGILASDHSYTSKHTPPTRPARRFAERGQAPR
jgi:hypothetical protein